MTTERPTPELPDDESDQEVVLDHVRQADVTFLAWLDAWIDKSISDGTLTPEKASAYREAIAARCAQLGEVPNIVGAVQRLDIKPGDVVAVIAPVETPQVLRQMHEHLRAYLEGTGVQAVIFPPGTRVTTVHPVPPRTWEYPVGGALLPVPPYKYGPEWPEPGTPEYDALQARWEAALAVTLAKDTLLKDERQYLPIPPFMPAESVVWPEGDEPEREP
jgi:hypothetical protein